MASKNVKFTAKDATGWPRSCRHEIPCVFPVLQKFSLCFFIEELTVIVIKEMSLAPSYTIYFLLKPYTA